MSAALRLLAALLAGSCVAALAIAARSLYASLRQQLPAARAGRTGLFAALRKSAVAVLAPLNQRFMPPAALAFLESRVRRAGRPHALSPAEIAACMELCGLAFLCAGAAASGWLGVGAGCAALLAAAGACSPLLWLHDKARSRRFAITRALPWSLDLLTLSVEAGLDFAAALAKVVEKGRKGPLCDELSISLRELKLGKTREEALRNLARRVELPTLTSFVHALLQADRLGTPLGKVLRILSAQLRLERTQRAEKLANEAPVKLLFPLVVFIFPTLFLMLFAPIAFQILGGSF